MGPSPTSLAVITSEVEVVAAAAAATVVVLPPRQLCHRERVGFAGLLTSFTRSLWTVPCFTFALTANWCDFFVLVVLCGTKGNRFVTGSVIILIEENGGVSSQRQSRF